MLYGKESAETILSGGCVTKVFYPGLGLKTTKDVSELLGRSTEKIESKSQTSSDLGAKGSEGRTQSSIGRYLMTPDEIRCMKKEKAIVIRGNEKPLKIKITPFFKQRCFDEFVEYSNTNRVTQQQKAAIIASDIKEVIGSVTQPGATDKKESQLSPNEVDVVSPVLKRF